MALVISSVLVMLIGTTFVVQNQYYSSQTLRARAHDNARSATERVADELRTTMPGGLVVAGARTLTVRSPVALALLCGRGATLDYVHVEGSAGSSFDFDEVAGVALRDTLTGSWTYEPATWAALEVPGGNPAGACSLEGADTVGAYREFHALRQLDAFFGTRPPVGSVVMLYRETTFQIRPSTLETGTLGLYRQPDGRPAVEFATGMDATAQFRYRTGGSAYVDTVSAASLDDIDAVRIVADARKPARSGGQEDVTFGWSVNVALRNVP